jgi:predicted MPP superfamily phosphohydrolase
MQNNNKLKWIHLSDIHFKYNNFNTMRMRDMLIKKLDELSQDNCFSFILITGDLSYIGRIENTELSNFLDEILEKTHLDKNCLFIVPGNHDVSRSKPRNAVLQDLLSQNSTDIDIETEQFLLEGFSNFNNFYKNYMGFDYPLDKVHWVYLGDEYNLIGLNTAITCGMDNEETTLKIDSEKLYKALKQVEKSNNINIALGHHGLDCLTLQEKNNTINQFDDYGIDLYLCGHVHQSNYTISADGNRDIPTITCGAAMVDDYSTACFVIESFNGEYITAQYYVWNKTNQQWIVDNAVSRKADNNGLISFSIKDKQNSNEDNTFLDSDSFQDFIINFHLNFDSPPEIETQIFTKDISEKFTNMKCNQSMIIQYNKLSIYFPIITGIMNSTAFMSSKDKLIVPNVIIEAYNNNLDNYDSGHRILENMIQDIYNNYKDKVNYPESTLKLYIKILCYWLIYECDIFDDSKE